MSSTLEGLPRLLTAGVMAELLGVSRDRVLNVLKRRKHIRPRFRAGNARLYPTEALALVRHELNKIDARKASVGDDDSLFDPAGGDERRAAS